MPRGGTSFKALCKPTGEHICDLPCARQVLFLRWCGDLIYLCLAGTVAKFGDLMPWSAHWAGMETRTPASRRDRTGIQWYSVDKAPDSWTGGPQPTKDLKCPNRLDQNKTRQEKSSIGVIGLCKSARDLASHEIRSQRGKIETAPNHAVEKAASWSGKFSAPGSGPRQRLALP